MMREGEFFAIGSAGKGMSMDIHKEYLGRSRASGPAWPLFVFVLSLGQFALAYQAPKSEPSAKRIPVPDKATRDQKRTEVISLFSVDKARTAEEKKSVAAKLLATAKETTNDPSAKFALLNLAREQAADAAQIKLALEIVADLEQNFDFDADAVRTATFEQAAKAATSAAAKREIVVAGAEAIEQLLTDDKYDRAAALADRMLILARPLRDAELLKSLTEQRKQAATASAEFAKVIAVYEKIKEAPNDPEANFHIGRYLLAVKKDATAAIPYLAKGTDAALKAAALSDQENPQTPEAMEKLAESWWSAGELQKDAELKKSARARSVVWYQAALPLLTGIAKVRAETRLKEIGEVSAPSARPVREANQAVELLDFVDVTRHPVKQKWERREKEVVALQGPAPLLSIPVTISGSYEVSIEFTREAGGDIVGAILPVGDRFCNVILSAGGGATDLVGEEVNPKVTISPSRLRDAKRHLLKAKVQLGDREAVVDVSLDDQRYDRWTGVGVTNEGGPRKLPLTRHFGLYGNESRIVFHSVKLTMTSGKAGPDLDAVNPKRPK